MLQRIYVDARVPDDLGTPAAALAVALPGGAVVCRRTAAWLYGVDAREPGGRDKVPLLDAAVPVGRAPVRRAGVKGVVQSLSGRDVGDVAGIPVTTPLRTDVDLARWLPRRSAMACVDALLHLRLVGLDELTAEVERFAGYSFIDQVPDLVGPAEPKTESFGESWLRLRIVDSGFPRLEPQVQVREADGVLVARIDLGDRARRRGVEYDGEAAHSRPKDRAHDEVRRARPLRHYGWEVIGFDKAAVLGRSRALEEAVAALLRVVPGPRRMPAKPPPPDTWDFTGELSGSRRRRASIA